MYELELRDIESINTYVIENVINDNETKDSDDNNIYYNIVVVPKLKEIKNAQIIKYLDNEYKSLIIETDYFKLNSEPNFPPFYIRYIDGQLAEKNKRINIFVEKDYMFECGKLYETKSSLPLVFPTSSAKKLIVGKGRIDGNLLYDIIVKNLSTFKKLHRSMKEIAEEEKEPFEQKINERFDILEQKIDNNNDVMNKRFDILEQKIDNNTNSLQKNFEELKNHVTKQIELIDERIKNMKNDLLKTFESSRRDFLKEQKKFLNKLDISETKFRDQLKNSEMKASFKEAKKLFDDYWEQTQSVKSTTITAAGMKTAQAMNPPESYSDSNSSDFENKNRVPSLNMNDIIAEMEKYTLKSNKTIDNLGEKIIQIIFKYDDKKRNSIEFNDWIDTDYEKMKHIIENSNPQADDSEDNAGDTISNKSITPKEISNLPEYHMFEYLTQFMKEFNNQKTIRPRSPLTKKNLEKHNQILSLSNISGSKLPVNVVYKNPLKF